MSEREKYHAEWPPVLQGGTPATAATRLAEWAEGDARRLWGATLSGNGVTQKAFLRRLSEDDLWRLFAHAQEFEVCDQGHQLPRTCKIVQVEFERRRWAAERQARNSGVG